MELKKIKKEDKIKEGRYNNLPQQSTLLNRSANSKGSTV